MHFALAAYFIVHYNKNKVNTHIVYVYYQKKFQGRSLSAAPLVAELNSAKALYSCQCT